jgi:hypothetical protein
MFRFFITPAPKYELIPYIGLNVISLKFFIINLFNSFFANKLILSFVLVFTFLDLGFCLNFHRNKKKVSVGSKIIDLCIFGDNLIYE